MPDEENDIKLVIQKRQGVIVFLYHMKQIKQLKRFGIIQYISKKMKYVVIYMNQEDLPETVKKIQNLKFVKKTEVSHRPDIDMDFGSRMGEKAFKLTDEDQEKFKNKSE
ncbi:YlbG family protein [Dellaglioa sp. L3N]